MNPPPTRAMHMALSELQAEAEYQISLHDRNVEKGVGFANVRGQLDSRYWSLYIRVGMAHIDGMYYQSVELARININTRYQNRGLGSMVVDLLEQLAKKRQRVFIVENVLNAEFSSRLSSRRGFKKTTPSLEGAPTYYKHCTDTRPPKGEHEGTNEAETGQPPEAFDSGEGEKATT